MPGTYELNVRVDPGTPSERLGRAPLEVGFTAKALHVRVETRPTGTGKTIRGSIRADGKHDVNKVRVSASCNRAGRYTETVTQVPAAGLVLRVRGRRHDPLPDPWSSRSDHVRLPPIDRSRQLG